jgi:hypothetical protein
MMGTTVRTIVASSQFMKNKITTIPTRTKRSLATATTPLVRKSLRALTSPVMRDMIRPASIWS